MQQTNFTSTSQVIGEVQKILASHYGIKIASLVEVALANGVKLDDLVSAYYGEPKTAKQRRASRQALKNFILRYGKGAK